jgi:hypothetical protein
MPGARQVKRPEQRIRFRRKSLIEMTAPQRERAAAMATYTGSPEHKLPHARSDATLCPAGLEGQQAKLTAWLRSALAAGHAGGLLMATPSPPAKNHRN